MEVEEEQPETLTAEIVDKYKKAADVVNFVMAEVVAASTPGTKIVELCMLGDRRLNEKLATTFSKVEKGVAFPTCLSVNNCVGHYSPLSDDTKLLEEGDLVKIDMGAHIDGYIATGAHSFISTANPQEAVSGKKADVICAAHFAAECALRLFRPGKTNTEVTRMINKVAEAFNCTPVEGVLSHQMRRYVIDGNNVVLNKETSEQQVNEVTFEEGDVFGFDILISTGEGKPKEAQARTTVYKRAVEQNYNLKMKASRALFSEINKKFPTYPFTLRSLDDERKGRLGITECIKHSLVDPYPVLFEKPGEYVAQFKFTAVITTSQTSRLIAHPLPFVTSEFQLTDPEITQLLALGTKRGAKKKKNKKRKKSTSATTATADEKQKKEEEATTQE